MISFGPGGTAGLGYKEGLEEIRKRGLSALEVEFTYGVQMSNEEAAVVGKIAKQNGIALSVHAPYYINLASREKPKLHASANRIMQSCERAHHLGASHVVFHAGFYQGRAKEEVFEEIQKEIEELQKKVKEKGWKVLLAPETTGKQSQFGDIDELLRMMKETGCSICVDYSHLKARTNGRMQYGEMAERIKKIGHVHSHFSGIEYTEKGERRHIMTPESEAGELIGALLKSKVDARIINESPEPIGDAEMMKRVMEKMRGEALMGHHKPQRGALS